jgi:putative resolvase
MILLRHNPSDVMFTSPSETAHTLGVSLSTLRNWSTNGTISYITTPGGHRRYDSSTMQQQSLQPIITRQYNLPSKRPKEEPERNKTRTTGALYCRVSSWKQKDDLRRQIDTLQEQYPDYKVFSDICSGLNYKRKELSRLLEQVQAGTIKEVVVAHKDRLARFGTELIEWIIKQAGASLVVLDQALLSPTEEITQDLMAIIHVFSCRLNGKRRYNSTESSRKKQKIKVVQEPGSSSKRGDEEDLGPGESSQHEQDAKD